MRSSSGESTPRCDHRQHSGARLAPASARRNLASEWRAVKGPHANFPLALMHQVLASVLVVLSLAIGCGGDSFSEGGAGMAGRDGGGTQAGTAGSKAEGGQASGGGSSGSKAVAGESSESSGAAGKSSGGSSSAGATNGG